MLLKYLHDNSHIYKQLKLDRFFCLHVGLYNDLIYLDVLQYSAQLVKATSHWKLSKMSHPNANFEGKKHWHLFIWEVVKIAPKKNNELSISHY